LFRRDAAEQAHQFRLQRSERRLRHRASRMNHDVPSRRNLRFITPQNFTNSAAYAIAHHSATQSLLHADAESADAVWPCNLVFVGSVVGSARLKCLLRAEENCKLRARPALSGAVY